MVDYEQIKEMAAARGQRVNDLLALAPKNDPFYTGTPADLARAEWFENIYTRAGYSAQRAPHLRRIHYWTVSQEPPINMPDGKPYENTEKCWAFLIEAGKAARYLGYVPMNGIVDNKNPNPHIHANYLDEEPGFRLYIPDLAFPHVWVDGIENVNAQPYHLEVWCEKSTMNDVLLPICQRFNANLVTFEGEVSITAVCVNLMQRIQDSGEKPTRIFYISDFDPAGNSMPVAMSRKLEFALVDRDIDVRVQPIALTADLVKKYRLPRIPIKETERRAEKFEASFGTGAVELDALEALYPGTLAKIVGNHLSDFYSKDAEAETQRRSEALRQAVSTKIEAITSRYAQQIAALKAMQDELRAIEVDVEDFRVDRFEPEAEEWEEDWLFVSDRDYIDQISFYKAHKSGGAADD